MSVITLRVGEEIKEALAEYASKQNVNQSEIVRRALKAYLEENEQNGEKTESPKDKKGRLAMLAGDLIGSLEGTSDLSVNPKYMEGYGE
jgi:predicted transcriptional regulator